MTKNKKHIPVLLKETIEFLNIKYEGVYIDCTLGGGGHAREILKHLGPRGRLIGIEQDPLILAVTQDKLSDYKEKIEFIQGNFRNLQIFLKKLDITQVDGVLFDLGVSSFQLDEGYRGFSYQQVAKLDMRMDPQGPISAWDLVNRRSEEELAKIIRNYGEERWAARIAHFIVERRMQKPVDTTAELVEIIKKAIPASARRTGPHPAKRTFQALRIAVNDEIEAFREALEQSFSCLTPGGRVVVISFHSLEDRIVKQSMQKAANPCICPPDFPVCSCSLKPSLRILTRKPVTPSSEEIRINSRARSARLRAAEKI